MHIVCRKKANTSKYVKIWSYIHICIYMCVCIYICIYVNVQSVYINVSYVTLENNMFEEIGTLYTVGEGVE